MIWKAKEKSESRTNADFQVSWLLPRPIVSATRLSSCSGKWSGGSSSPHVGRAVTQTSANGQKAFRRFSAPLLCHLQDVAHMSWNHIDSLHFLTAF